MEKPRVKGDVFLRVSAYIVKKWGKAGLARVNMSPDQYKPETWYPLNDFISLLLAIKANLAESEDSISNIARDTITSDDRWTWAFKDKNPEVVFSSTARQDALYKMGEFNVLETSPGFMRLKMALWENTDEKRDVFAEFYKGRLLGVLDLTGFKGNVEQKYCTEEGCKNVVYAIFWI